MTLNGRFGKQKKVSDFATAYLADTISTNFPTDKKGFVQKSNDSATKMTNGDADNIVFLKAGLCHLERRESLLGNFVLRRNFSGENPSLQKYKRR